MATAEPPSSQTAVDVRTDLGGPIAPPGFMDLQPPSGSQAPPSIMVGEPVSSIQAFLTQADGHPSPSSIGRTAQATFTTQALGGLAAPIARLSTTYAGARPCRDGTVGDICHNPLTLQVGGHRSH